MYKIPIFLNNKFKQQIFIRKTEKDFIFAHAQKKS